LSPQVAVAEVRLKVERALEVIELLFLVELKSQWKLGLHKSLLVMEV
jgi:hypothetical protein